MSYKEENQSKTNRIATARVVVIIVVFVVVVVVVLVVLRCLRVRRGYRCDGHGASGSA